MAEFVIKLADERGHVQEQVQTAATAEELRARFSHAGYHVFSVRARGGLGLGRHRKVKLEPFLIFNQQFLTLIRAGLPILGSIQMLGKIQKNAAFSSQLEDVSTRVKRGEALSAAFEAQSGFPLMYTTTLLAGERSGNLPEVLDRYVSFQKVALALRKKLIGSLIYPCVLLTLVCGLLTFMFTVVVPQFAQLYDQLGSKLPALTVDLLNFGKWMQHNILWLALAVLTIAVAGYRFAITERGRDFIDGVPRQAAGLRQDLAQVPGGAFLAHAFHAAHRRLAAGAFARDGGRSISSRRVSKAVQSSIGTVREGKSLADSLARTKVFPDLASEMITVGEQTGALPQMLNSVAEFFEEDVATALAAALALIEPAILIVMGCVVVFILISLYLPIFSLGQATAM